MRFLLTALFVAEVAGKPRRLKLLDESLARSRGAQCLDHSPAGYYIREQDPRKWVIFLEGGGLCVTAIDCIARKHTDNGSSKRWHPTQPPEGPSTTSLSDLNPFANFSHVWVPYCSGDTWLGNSAQSRVSLLGAQMSGHLILDTIVEELLNTTKMSSATDVILSGSSAGGIAVYHHLDWFADKLASSAQASNLPTPRVAGFPMEGMFFPQHFPVEFEQYVVGNRRPLNDFMSKYLNLLQDPWLHPGCTKAAREKHFPVSECFDVSKMVSYVRTPLFICQNHFDKLLIQDVGLCLRCETGSSPTGWLGKYIRFFGSLQNQTVHSIKANLPQTGIFMPSEFHHDENFYHFLDSHVKTIKGVSLREAFEAWYWNRSQVMLIEATCNDGGPCSPSLEIDPPPLTILM